MGYNRGGKRRTARLRRRKRLENRLAQKLSAGAEPSQKPPSTAQKVKEMAKGVVEKVEGVLHAAAEKIKGAVK